MKEPFREKKWWDPVSLARMLFGRDLPLERETTQFILVSVLDLLMTYLLLRYTANGRLAARFVESNAVARFFLHHWGIRGMIFFKLSMVAVVTVIAQIVATKRLETARRLLNVATFVVAAVVIYSLVLFLKNLG